MPTINFPSSPTVDDIYTFEGRSWIYNGSGWKLQQANLTYSSVVSALGYPPLSVYGGTLSGNLTITTAAFVANGLPGNAGQALHSNGTGVYWANVTSIAGSNTQVQFNDSGFANATSGFTFDKTTNTITVDTATINNTNYSGTSNNSLYLGGTIASGYQTTAGLSANVATLAANSSTYANASISNTFTIGTAAYHVSNGNFGVGTNTPSSKLVVSGGSEITSLGIGTAPSGTTGEIRATDNITAYYSSDQRLKNNVVEISNALDKINSIRGVEFDWSDDYIEKRGGDDGYFIRKHDVGVIAQEIEKVLPEVVAERNDGIKAVKYDRIVALLIQAIKEQQEQIKTLERIINN